MYVHKNITSEIIDSMVGRMEEQKKFELVVEHLKESLIILNDNRIEMANTMFLCQFGSHIQDCSMPEARPASVRIGFLDRIKGYIRKIRNVKEERVEDQ